MPAKTNKHPMATPDFNDGGRYTTTGNWMEAKRTVTLDYHFRALVPQIVCVDFWDSIDELLAALSVCRVRQEGMTGHPLADRYGVIDRSFTEAANWFNLLTQGNTETVQRLSHATMDIRRALKPKSGDRPESYAAVAGHAPNVGAYLSGSPEAMHTWNRTEKPTNIFRIAYSATIGGPSAETLFNRGAALIAMIEALEALGYSTQIDAYDYFGGNGITRGDLVQEAGARAQIADAGLEEAQIRETWFGGVTIKRAGRPLDLDVLATFLTDRDSEYALFGPIRRYLPYRKPATKETTRAATTFGSGTGPVPLNIAKGYNFVIHELNGDPPEFSSADSAAVWIRTVLAAQGIDLLFSEAAQ